MRWRFMTQVSKNNLSEALRFIVEKFGKETLLDAHKVKRILNDVIPNSQTEINWIIDAIYIDIVEILINENEDRHNLIDKARVKLDAQYVSEVRRDYIIECIAYGLGWTSKSVAPLEDYQDLKKGESYKSINNKKPSGIKLDKEKQKKDKVKKLDLKKIKEEDTNNNKNKYVQKQDTTRNINRNDQNNNNRNNNEDKPRYNSDTKKGINGKLFIIPIIALIVIALIAKSFMGSEVSVENIYFNADTTKEDSTYVFNDVSVNMNIVLDGDSIKSDNIGYDVEDTNVCSLINNGNSCNILFNQNVEDSTDLIIYYDDDEIYRLNIAYRRDSANINNIGDIGQNEEVDTSRNTLSQEEADGMKACLEGFYRNYGNAVYSGDISYLDNFIYYNGPFYKGTKSNLESWYGKGIESRVTSYTMVRMRKENGEFIATAQPEFDVYNQKGHFYMKESMDYVFSKSGTEFKIYEVRNWKQLQKEELD